MQAIRKMVSKDQGSFHVDGNTLNQVLEECQKLIKEYGEDATIEWYADPYSDNRYLHVYKLEPETDEEMVTRVQYEEKWAKLAEERDAQEFKRLQAKFGK